MPNCNECDKVFRPGCLEALAREMLEYKVSVCQCALPVEALAALCSLLYGEKDERKDDNH